MAEQRWHPLLAAVEGPVGEWRLMDAYDRHYGTVRLVRVDGEPAYRCELRGSHIGYRGTQREACEFVHWAFIRAHAPGGKQAGLYPDFGSARSEQGHEDRRSG